jgi:diguanylate cyclase (GGDEF)-like protein
MDTDDFIEFHTDDAQGVLTAARRGNDFFEGCERDAKLYVHEDDQKVFVEVMNREFLEKALAERNVFEFVYRRILDGRAFYVRMKISRMEDDDRFIVLAVADIEDEMKQRKAEKRREEERIVYARLHALTGNFLCVYVVDPETGKYREFSATSNYEESFAQAKEGVDFFNTVRDAAAIFTYPDDKERFFSIFTKENVLDEIQRSGIFTLGYRLVMEGKPVHIQMKAAMIEEKEGMRLIVGLNNVDTQVRQEEEYGKRLAEAQSQATVDALTHVKNRQAYLQNEARMDRQIEEGSISPFAIVVMDVNDLKKVNDTKGHQAGDQCLKDACKMICEIFKHSPVFRIGGDEFVVILRNEDFQNRMNLADEFYRESDKINATAHNEWEGVHTSMGIVTYDPLIDRAVSDTVRRADKVMYEKKRSGKR